MNSNDLLLMVPEWFQRVLEFPEIMKAWAYALGVVDGNVKQLWDNQYIQTCDEATLSLYEKLLGITPSGTDTLAYRRAIVLNKYSMTVPFSEGYLRTRLNDMFGEDGYELTIDSETSTVTLVISAAVPNALRMFFDMWYGIAPAHLHIIASESLNTLLEGAQYYGAVITSSVCHSF